MSAAGPNAQHISERGTRRERARWILTACLSLSQTYFSCRKLSPGSTGAILKTPPEIYCARLNSIVRDFINFYGEKEGRKRKRHSRSSWRGLCNDRTLKRRALSLSLSRMRTNDTRQRQPVKCQLIDFKTGSR